MKYEKTVVGRFVERPNRFIAVVEVDGAVQVCHVKNTGRCRELLLPGAKVVLAAANNPARKTAYDLVAVYKGERLINMDSQAPNLAVGEYLRARFPGAVVRPEVTVGASRLDFAVETDTGTTYVEVKGVTLERDGVVLFPDAPTARGAKHLGELARLAGEGHDARVLFVIQMGNVQYFTPNRETDPAFADALLAARKAGVAVEAVDCTVVEDGMVIGGAVPVRFSDK